MHLNSRSLFQALGLITVFATSFAFGDGKTDLGEIREYAGGLCSPIIFKQNGESAAVRNQEYQGCIRAASQFSEYLDQSVITDKKLLFHTNSKRIFYYGFFLQESDLDHVIQVASGLCVSPSIKERIKDNFEWMNRLIGCQVFVKRSIEVFKNNCYYMKWKKNPNQDETMGCVTDVENYMKGS